MAKKCGHRTVGIGITQVSPNTLRISDFRTQERRDPTYGLKQNLVARGQEETSFGAGDVEEGEGAEPRAAVELLWGGGGGGEKE